MRSGGQGTARLTPDIAAVSALDDPVRASVYLHVDRAREPLSRDDVAKALRVTRRTAAIHLDRLAGVGLLDVSFKRLSGRTGPGAGRTSKLYRRSARRLSVSLPARNYELMAGILAAAIKKRRGRSPASSALESQARTVGFSIGGEAKKGLYAAPTEKRLLNALYGELDTRGFEPFFDAERTLRLRNCPFHELARQDEQMVCRMNQALLQGVVDGLGLGHLSAALEPSPSTCCVAFRSIA